jgi:sigma-B regulation protein RsbU (phosphoserine phosphatase)
MFPDSEYVTNSCRIETPSTLYVFSDGLYEIGQEYASWSFQGLTDLIQTLHHEDSPDLDVLLARIQSLAGASTFNDDVALLRAYLD